MRKYLVNSKEVYGNVRQMISATSSISKMQDAFHEPEIKWSGISVKTKMGRLLARGFWNWRMFAFSRHLWDILWVCSAFIREAFLIRFFNVLTWSIFLLLNISSETLNLKVEGSGGISKSRKTSTHSLF